jgi:hypothetical protein
MPEDALVEREETRLGTSSRKKGNLHVAPIREEGSVTPVKGDIELADAQVGPDSHHTYCFATHNGVS